MRNLRVARTLGGVLLTLAIATSADSMSLNDTFHILTTPVIATTPDGQSQGTAFFYSRLAPKTKEGPEWRTVIGTWLVTNRHVVLPKVKGKELMPSVFVFHLRRLEESGPRWEPVTLALEDLRRRVRVHKDPSVDVAVIDVADLLTAKIIDAKAKYAMWYPVTPDNFAGQNNIDVQASDDVVIVGYPRGFYDDANLYPIVKAGIIASRWGANFGGHPYFLIDAKLFPGSSGSIVISKPRDLVVKEGRLLQSSEKQFAFLGIYSGEPMRLEQPVELESFVIIQKSGFNVGIVWYANLVEEIIDQGVEIPKP